MTQRAILARRALAGVVALAAFAGTAGTAAAAEPGVPEATVSAVGTSPSAGCGTAPPPAGTETQTIESSGIDRTYDRHLPPAHDGESPLPLVLAIHGLSEGSQVHQQMSGYPGVADEEGFVVAFPQGLGTPAQWSGTPGSNDMVLMTDILDELEADLCLDRNRIYVSGLSMGAFMTASVACAYADRVAAVGAVAGLVDPAGCAPSRPVPVIAFHGTVDPILPYAPVPAAAAAWAARNGCGTPPTDEVVGADEVVEIHRISYPCGADAAPVELYRIDDGGHAWPGSEFSRSIEALLGYTTFEIDATREMWAFFQANPLGGAEEPAETGIQGTVVGPDGTPVAGAAVWAYASDDVWVGTASTTSAADGTFSIDGLAPGTYQVLASPPAGSGLPTGWLGGTSRDDATPVDAAAGEPASVVVSLAEAGSVSGSVTDAYGQPVEGAWVWAYDADDRWVGTAAAPTGADGTYALEGVAVGEYRIAFVPPAGSGLAGQWYDASATRSAATPVAVTAGSALTGIDARLAPAS